MLPHNDGLKILHVFQQGSSSSILRHSSISLPTTLKKYKGHHSTETCKHIHKSKSKEYQQQPHHHQHQQKRDSSPTRSNTNHNLNKVINKANTSSSFSASVSCDKILNTTNSSNLIVDDDDSDDNILLDSVIVNSEHDLENLNKKLNE